MAGKITRPDDWDDDCLFGRPALERQTTVLGKQETSREAARVALGRSGTQRFRIYALVQMHDGLTADELEVATRIPMNSITPRINELVSDGWLVDSGLRRATRYGKQAIVWKVA